jgi:hypothetical protein
MLDASAAIRQQHQFRTWQKPRDLLSWGILNQVFGGSNACQVLTFHRRSHVGDDRYRCRLAASASGDPANRDDKANATTEV